MVYKYFPYLKGQIKISINLLDYIHRLHYGLSFYVYLYIFLCKQIQINKNQDIQ